MLEQFSGSGLSVHGIMLFALSYPETVLTFCPLAWESCLNHVIAFAYRFVVELYSIVQKKCKRILTKFLAFRGFSKKFCLKRYFDEISLHFRDTYCFDLRNFSNDNSLCSMIHLEFSCDNSLLSKSHCDFSNDNSSRKFDLLFINRPRAFLKHSSLTEIPK